METKPLNSEKIITAILVAIVMIYFIVCVYFGSVIFK